MLTDSTICCFRRLLHKNVKIVEMSQSPPVPQWKPSGTAAAHVIARLDPTQTPRGTLNEWPKSPELVVATRTVCLEEFFRSIAARWLGILPRADSSDPSPRTENENDEEFAGALERSLQWASAEPCAASENLAWWELARSWLALFKCVFHRFSAPRTVAQQSEPQCAPDARIRRAKKGCLRVVQWLIALLNDRCPSGRNLSPDGFTRSPFLAAERKRLRSEKVGVPSHDLHGLVAVLRQVIDYIHDVQEKKYANQAMALIIDRCKRL